MDGRLNHPLQIDLSITVSGATVGRIAELLPAILSGASIRGKADLPQPARTPQQTDELVLDRSQTAKLLKVSGSTLSRMVRNRQMPGPLRFGQTVRWRRDEIESWVKAGCPPMDSWDYQPKQKNL